MSQSSKKEESPCSPTGYTLSDPPALMTNMVRVMDKMAELATFYAKIAEKKPTLFPFFSQQLSLEGMLETLGEVAQFYLSNPQDLLESHFKLWQSHAKLWENGWKAFLGEATSPIITEQTGDKRFADPDWEKQQVFNFLKQSYLITTQWARDLVISADLSDPHVKHKAKFYVEQIANALSPSNFALTNPEILKLTLSCNGENLVRGLDHLLKDLISGEGDLKISQTDLEAFKVGENLANTPGKVVFRNDLIELLHYTPLTEKTRAVPLLIIPPWINKFYILDLNPKKSFIRWCLSQGLSVFVVSWVNPDQHLSDKTFSDYMNEGILEALSAVKTAAGASHVNTIGYCVGGTLLACTLGYLAQKQDASIATATFLTTQVDFSEAGDLMVFIDEEQIKNIETQMEQKGYLEAQRMSQAFNLLRSNDLIWSYVVNNYLKGKAPVPFDLLYWNSDSTRMPARAHAFYLRECYLKNALAQGTLVLDGEPIRLSEVSIPIYNLAARDDHIAPLPSVFKVGHHFPNTRLVVAGSGHIAGVINPPEAKKYSYWTLEEKASSPEEWLSLAQEHTGSWWVDWGHWIAERSGEWIPALQPGEGALPALDEAPGSYVRGE